MTAQLIDAQTGHHLWAERHDRVLDDLFELQDELTAGIGSAIEATVGRAETERVRRRNPANLNA